MANIVDSRGHFWWSDQSPDQSTGLPPLTVAGRLTIEENGRIFLALDGLLSEGLDSMIRQSNSRQMISDKAIVGLLYEDSSSVYLTCLRITRSQFGSSTVCREEYQALYCLCGDCPSLSIEHLSMVRGFQLDLANIKEWIRMPSIKALDEVIVGNLVSQAFEYCQDKAQYSTADGTMSIDFDIDGDFSLCKMSGVEKVSFASVAKFSYQLNTLIRIDQLPELIFRIQECLALLVGAYVDLGWPRIFINAADTDSSARLYFRRNRPIEEKPSISDLWTFFPGVRDSVGLFFDSFMSLRGQFGPGVYLYLACLRTESMFPENRFTTLITGLESLYRRDLSLPQESSKERDRIERILLCVQQESDKKWLRRKLDTRAELSLEDRLNRLFEPLTRFVDVGRLKVFAGKCAELRNDVTHFGGLRGQATYPQLLERLGALTPALASLYHALLLYRMGVPTEVIGNAFNSGPVSSKIKRNLVQAGLREEEKASAPPFPPMPQLQDKG